MPVSEITQTAAHDLNVAQSQIMLAGPITYPSDANFLQWATN